MTNNPLYPVCKNSREVIGLLHDTFKPHLVVKKQKLEATVNEQAEAQRHVLIIDTLGKLQLTKWRLMSDQLKVMYVTKVPTPQEVLENNPGVIIMQVSVMSGLFDYFEQLTKMIPDLPVLVAAAKNEEYLLRKAFARGAKAIFTFPVDLPKVSLTCKKELDKQTSQKVQVAEINVSENEYQVVHNISKIEHGNEKIPNENYDFRLEIINHLDVVIAFFDSRGRIAYNNLALLELLHHEGDSLTGKCWGEVFGAEGTPMVLTIKNMLAEAIEKNVETKNVETILPNGVAPPTTAIVNIKPVFDEAGIKKGTLFTATRVENVKEREKTLARSEKLAVAGQLAAGAVHEIKNPLTSVRGFIQLLQQELSGNPKAEYIDIIISEIDRVNNIVNEFLKLAKPAVPQRSSCSLTGLFEEMRVIMESEAFLKNVVIEESYSHLPPVKIDKEQIKQVLINIIQNSFDAMPEGGKLCITAESLEMEKKIKISFADTGEGISAETLCKIFNPFFTTKDHGTGLGLSVSQQILESHNGHIEIESRPGKGTTTTIYLPY